MNNDATLTVAFLDQAPAVAARELQTLPIEEAAALIDTVPTRLSGPVIGRMIPWYAARLLDSVSASKAAGVLRHLGFADSVSLTRLIAPHRREQLFEALPVRWSRRLRSALAYPQHQVGAWIDPEVPTLGVSNSVTDALRVLREADSASHVFIESDGHEKYAGVIPVRDLLRAEKSASLQQLAVLRPEPVSNRATLSALTFDDRWDDYLHLPVIGRRGNLLGGLSRKTLRHAIHEQHATDPGSRSSLIHDVAFTFGMTCLAIIRLGAAAKHSPSIDIVEGSSHEH